MTQISSALPDGLRKDQHYIADHIPCSSRVLELGCGDGALLHYLTAHKQVDGRGIEISQSGARACVRHGLSVIQGNAETDLQHYPDACFDYVVSSQVLQATHNPKDVLQEILRIGKHAVISIPNFGYWKNRLYLGFKGRMPVTRTLSYQWYETPNIHFCTIYDFELLCRDLGAQIDSRFLVSEKERCIPPWFMPNLLANKAVYILRS